jgi:hypothetical protein
MRPLAAVLLLLASCAAPPAPALSADEERVLRPVPDAPESARPLIERGDALFVRALTPHRAGDAPAALDLYGKARASYLEAETHCAGIIPPPLLDRVKECVYRIAALQRQLHGSK